MDKLNALYAETMRRDAPRRRGRPRQFDEEEIQQIRLDTRPLDEVAFDWHVTRTTICAIKNRDIYGDVEGESFVGSPGPRPKLPESSVLAIRASEESNKVLAQRYGVTPNRIWQLRKDYKAPIAGAPAAIVDGRLTLRAKRRLTKSETQAVLDLLASKRRPSDQ